MSRIRRTTFSPKTVPALATRMSTERPSISIAICPSWGLRRSTMFMPAMILIRLTSPAPMLSGRTSASCSAPSMRKRTRSCVSCGSMWTSEARSRSAWVIIMLTTWTTGASSPTVSTRETARLDDAPLASNAWTCLVIASSDR